MDPETVTTVVNNSNNFQPIFVDPPGIIYPSGIYTQQDNMTQQQIDDWLRNMQQTGIGPIYPTQMDPTYDRMTLIKQELNNIKESKERKAQCLHMLTDLYFCRQKLTFEECQNLLGMIHSMDEENLVMAEIILKNKFNGREAKPAAQDQT